MKSLAMLNFKNLSPIADFSSKLIQFEVKLETIQKNVLYCTHMDDKILKLLKTLTVDKDLQATVDEFFENEGEAHPDLDPYEPTSPQTDRKNK